REPAGLPDTTLHRFRHLPQVRVTVREFAPRIADANNRASLVGGYAKAFGFKGRASEPAIQLGGIKPIATAVTGMRRGRHNGRSHGAYCGLREMSAAIIPLLCADVCRFSKVMSVPARLQRKSLTYRSVYPRLAAGYSSQPRAAVCLRQQVGGDDMERPA